jgi:hypothetical protein
MGWLLNATAARGRNEAPDSRRSHMKRIQDVMTSARKYNTAALFAVLLALTSFANAESLFGGHKGKIGNLKITVPTEVGGVSLQPGEYEVKEVNAPNGRAVEFIREVYNPYAQEGLNPHEEEVVGQVEFTSQALDAAPKHTQLVLTPDTQKAMALKVRGGAVEYVFAEPEMSQTAAMADCNQDGHE